MIQEITLTAGASGYISMDDDDVEVEGRILTTEELIARLNERGDIFTLDNEKRLFTSEAMAVCCAMIVGMGMTKMDIPEIGMIPDPVFTHETTRPGTIRDALVERPAVPVPRQEIRVDRKTLHARRPANPSTTASPASGVGDPRSRVARMGIFGMTSNRTDGRAVDGDNSSLGGLADGIDAIISGVNGLRPGNAGGITRRGQTGIGFRSGVGNSGFGPYSPGDDIGASPLYEPVKLTERQAISGDRLNIPSTVGVALLGGRNRSEILRVVMQNLQSLRYAYNQRLREKPELKGKIVCKFAIDEFGKVLLCEVVESTISDIDLEQRIKDMITRWRFEKIDKVGDVTEIVYPFVFSS